MFDNQYGVPRVDKIVQDFEEQLNVGKVQSGCRFIEQIERLSGTLLGEFLGELDALRLAARERGGRLAEFDIIEPDVMQRLQLVSHLRDVLEQLQQLLNIHLQHFGNRLAFELHLQRFTVVAMALADGARHPHVRQKVHLQLVRAISFTRLASATGHVKAKPSRFVAPALCLG